MLGTFSIRRVLIFLVLLLITLSPVLTLAQIPSQIVPCTGAMGDKPCTFCHIAQLAQNVLNTGIYIAVFLSAVLFAYAGWRYITAGGEPGKASEAKKVFWNVGIGLILILGAWLIVDLIMAILTSREKLLGPWNAICP